MIIARSADCTETITVMTKMVTSCVTAVPVRLIHMREVKKMTEKDLDVAIEKCERIMEMDARTMQNPVSENGWIFEKVYELLQYLRQFQFATDTNVATTDTISRQAAIETVRKAQSIGQAHRMLMQLPSAQPGWIPCSVMLPENDGVYLVTLRAITQLQKACAKIDIARFDGKWHKAYPVVAWMPLPKPWEGEQDERM